MTTGESVFEKKYLTRTNIVSFAVSGFGQSLIIGFVNSYILFFYTDVYLLGAGPASALMIIARIWDVFNDPVMGTLVDKTRTKWGKMRPYIIFTALPLAVSTASLFLIIPGLSQNGRIAYAYITYILWGIIYTLTDVPFWGLASAMTPNPKERIAFISISRLVHTVGGALPMVIGPLFVSLLGNRRGYTAAGVSIAIFGSALFLLAFFGTEERSKNTDKAPSLRECLGFLKINKPLQCVVAANILGFMRFVPLVAGMYVATYVLGEQTLRVFGQHIVLGGAALNTVLVAGWGASGYIGMILTPKICARFNYRQICYIAGIAGAVISALLLIVPKNIYTVFFAMLLVGFPAGVTININFSMIADSVDYVEWKTGRRTEGVTVSFQTLMNKVLTALQSALVSLSLVIFQFQPPVEKAGELVVQAQNELTLTGIILMMTLFPAAGWLLSMIPMRYYDFIGERHVEAHEAIKRRREETAAGKGGGAT